MIKIHEDIFPIENTELIHSAKRCVQILCFSEININFPNIKNNIRTRTALKESLLFLEIYRDFLRKIKPDISQKEHKILLDLLNYHLNIAKKISETCFSSKEIQGKIALYLPFEREKVLGKTIFSIFQKWVFSANYEIDSSELISEKLLWSNTLSECLEQILYLKEGSLCLYKDDLLAVYRLISLHTDNLTTLLMTDEERLQEIEVAKNFAKKVASSSAVVVKKKKAEEII